MPFKRKAGAGNGGSDTAKKGKAEEHDMQKPEAEVAATSESLHSSTLDSETQDLVKLIFDENMFKEVLQDLHIDVEKLPASQITLPLVDKAFAILEKLEEGLKFTEEDKKIIHSSSSKFYDLIPHTDCPVIVTKQLLQEKYDMLNVLADIELAIRIQKEQKEKQDDGKAQHPLDAKYSLLNCGLKLVSRSSQDFKFIFQYFSAKRGNLWRAARIVDVWAVDRSHEELEYTQKERCNRKLLWFGANVASTVAILKTGLHLKPHSNDIVGHGHGIYFSDDILRPAIRAAKSGDQAIMFLCEVALNSDGSHCRVQLGKFGPDKKKDMTVQFDGNDVVVPVGKLKPLCKYSNCIFATDYIISTEEEYRIRYIILFDNI